MDFGKFDIVLLTTMSLSIILMSFTFPALGLTAESDEQQESDVPEFNISQDSFNISGQFPETPGGPTRGTLEYDEDEGNSIPGMTLNWLDRPKNTGTSTEVQNRTDDAQIVFTNWSSTGTVRAEDRFNLSGTEGEEFRLQNESWVIEYEVTSVEDFRGPDMTFEVDYRVLEQPTDEEGGGLSAIPIIGGLFSAGEQLVSGLVWIGQVLFWGIAFIFEVAVTVVLILIAVMVYSVDMAVWLVTTYESIISGASTAWVQAVLVIPSVILFTEFAKLAMLGVKLLPTT